MFNKAQVNSNELKYLTQTTTEEVSKIISDLNSNISTGLDRVSVKALKAIKYLILDGITKTIKICLETGFFPDSLKVAKVTPIFKAGHRLKTIAPYQCSQ